jgi:hypothetical protein
MATSDHTLSGVEWLTRMSRGFNPDLDFVNPVADPVVTPGETMQYDYRKDLPAADPSAEPEPGILPMMVTELQPMKIASKIESSLSEIPWTRTVAAGSFVVGALLLIAGRRKSALAVSAAGAAVALLENPEIVRDAWNALPRLVRSGQDFLVRIEDFVEELNKQGQHLRKVIAHE